jgi:VanZ family protein
MPRARRLGNRGNLVAAAAKSRFHPRVSKLRKFLIYWLPLLFWMAVIFTASSDAESSHHSSIYFEPLIRWLFPQMPQTRIEELHYDFRKCCHMTEFAILAVLAWRAIRQPQHADRRPWRWDEAGLALAGVFLYASSDELHQVFVPSRTGQISDVVVDVIGGFIGLTLLWLAGKKFKRW